MMIKIVKEGTKTKIQLCNKQIQLAKKIKK